ncbi:MAG TPA: hypothetical protein VNN80_04595 [Polyangiaceae bacterium]|nr:hypothetical protein [Polyangiaceae bacterium]
MSLLLVLLSLLGACSGMLDLPEQPRVEESRAPLEAQPEHGAAADAWHGQSSRTERAAAPHEASGAGGFDAGTESPADGGVEVRISSR